jgi:hypothetical protein
MKNAADSCVQFLRTRLFDGVHFALKFEMVWRYVVLATPELTLFPLVIVCAVSCDVRILLACLVFAFGCGMLHRIRTCFSAALAGACCFARLAVVVSACWRLLSCLFDLCFMIVECLLEARGKPSTWFPRGWPVETERFSQFENSNNYCTIDIWSASQFARAPPLSRNTKIAHQPNPQCSDWSTSSLSTRLMWNLTLQHESPSHRRMHIVGVNFAFICRG